MRLPWDVLFAVADLSDQDMRFTLSLVSSDLRNYCRRYLWHTIVIPLSRTSLQDSMWAQRLSHLRRADVIAHVRHIFVQIRGFHPPPSLEENSIVTDFFHGLEEALFESSVERLEFELGSPQSVSEMAWLFTCGRLPLSLKRIELQVCNRRRVHTSGLDYQYTIETVMKALAVPHFRGGTYLAQREPLRNQLSSTDSIPPKLWVHFHNLSIPTSSDELYVPLQFLIPRLRVQELEVGDLHSPLDLLAILRSQPNISGLRIHRFLQSQRPFYTWLFQDCPNLQKFLLVHDGLYHDPEFTERY